jgi:hypothetical protein
MRLLAVAAVQEGLGDLLLTYLSQVLMVAQVWPARLQGRALLMQVVVVAVLTVHLVGPMAHPA